jgi:hypothetical protein
MDYNELRKAMLRDLDNEEYAKAITGIIDSSEKLGKTADETFELLALIISPEE